MNPIVHIRNNSLVVYELVKEDMNKLRRTKLISGGSSNKEQIINHQICIMQAASMVTHQHDKDPQLSRANFSNGFYTDNPICVSPAIRTFLINVNDSISDQSLRNKLKVLVKDIINTAPVVVSSTSGKEQRGKVAAFPDYSRAEGQRRQIFNELGPIKRYGVTEQDIKNIIKTVRKAAALYKTDQVEA